MGRPVVHFEIVGRDYEKVRAYYAELFDWEPDASNPMNYGILEREQNLTEDGVGIGGGISGAPPGYTNHLTFYVQVPDVEATLQAAERLGGTRLMGPDTITPETTIGLFDDPDGNRVGLIQG
ncbi:MAG: VOC family protein [Thermoleophilia bacterium]